MFSKIIKKSLEIIVSKTFILKLVGFAERLTIVSIKYLKFQIKTDASLLSTSYTAIIFIMVQFSVL